VDFGPSKGMRGALKYWVRGDFDIATDD
jgi:hypothetical protein